MTNLATSAEVRLLTGLTSSDISNDDLDDLIAYSTKMFIKDITIGIKDEDATGSINGTNSTFEVSKYPIADTSGNGTVGSEDITVYQWTDGNNPSTKSSIAVTTVYEREGKIVVTTAPSASINKVTVDYSYTLEENIDYELVKIAIAYLTGYIFAIKKFTILPECYSDDTKILTTEGWKLFKDLLKEDIVATYNSTTGNIEYQKINDIHNYFINDRMISIVTDNIDLLVTLNHKMIVKHIGNKGLEITDVLEASKLYKYIKLPYTKNNKDVQWELITFYKNIVSYTGLVYCVSVDNGYLVVSRNNKVSISGNSISRGPVRFRHFTKPYDEYYKKYQEVMKTIKSRFHIKKRSVDIETKRDRLI